MIYSLASMLVFGLLSQSTETPAPKNYMPAEAGRTWTYEVESFSSDGEKKKMTYRLSLNAKQHVEAGSDAVEAFPVLVNGLKSGQYLVNTEHGYDLVREGSMGFAGTPVLNVEERYLFNEKHWQFDQWMGCLYSVRKGEHLSQSKAIQVPAGEFKNTIKVKLSGESQVLIAWFAEDVGMVQQEVINKDKNHELWQLKSFEFPISTTQPTTTESK